MSRIEIKGGAGPAETAAVVAVVTHLIAEETSARGSSTDPAAQSPWVLAWRTSTIPAPLTTRSFRPPDWGSNTTLRDPSDGDT